MATATVGDTYVAVETNFWSRMAARLKGVGSKIKGLFFKATSYIKRAGLWAWNTTAIQWVVAKTRWLWSRLWYYAKGPVGWVTAGIAAIIFAPKAVAIMLVIALILLLVILFVIYRLYKAVQEEEKSTWTGTTDPVENAITAEETIDDRVNELDRRMVAARNAGQSGLISDLTGRLFLLQVRSGLGGKDSKLKKTATVHDIHRECREHAAALPGDIDWDWRRMYNAIRNEDARLNDIAKLKAKKPHLTSV